MEQRRNQFHHHTVSDGGSGNTGPKKTLGLLSGQDLNDENRKRSTHPGNSSVPQTSSTNNGSSSPQFSKKRKIRMGPQECLEYSSTSQGASALTNPQGLLKSDKDVNEKLYPVQRGRSHGSCFISPQEQSQSSVRNADHLAPTGSNNRQYISPSRGTGIKAENQGSVYDSSGFALIGGSPSKKDDRRSQFAVNAPKSLAGKSGQTGNKYVTNNWQKSKNVWEASSNSSSPTQSPPTKPKFISQPSGKVLPSQRSTVNDMQFSQGGKTFSQSSYQSQCSKPTTQCTSSPNKWKKTSGIMFDSTPSKYTGASFQRSPSSKMQLSNQSTQKLSQHATQQQYHYPQENAIKNAVSVTDNSQKKPNASQPSQFCQVQQKVGDSVSTQSPQTAKRGKISPKKQTLVTDFYTKTPPKDAGSNSESNVNTSVKRDLNQTWGSNLNVFSSSVKHSDKLILPQGEARDMEVTTTSDGKNIDSDLSKQGPLKMGLSCNVKAQDDGSNQTEPSSSQTSSTGSCNLTSLSIQPEDETKVDGDDLMEDESMSKPCSSSQTMINAGEDFEDDCIEDLMKDYEIDENGRIRLSQSSSGHSGSGNLGNFEVKAENRDLDDEVDSSDESQSFLRSLHANDKDEPTASLLKPKEEYDTNTAQSQEGKEGRENQSVNTPASRVNFSPKKELVDEGTKSMKIPGQSVSGPNDNSSDVRLVEGQQREQGFPCSAGSVSETVSQPPSKLGGSNSPPIVEFGDMPEEEEFPEELLAQIEAGKVVDDVSLKDRTFGLVGNGNEEEVEEENRDFFSTLPVEVIENVLSRIPIVDLMLSCSVVCHQWATIISGDSFIPWKKSYSRCKAGHDTWISPLKNSEKESCILDVIRFLSTLNRKPGESTVVDLQRHSNYEFAKDLIAENLPDLIKDGIPHPWSCVAALVVTAETVDDVQEIFQCLLHPTSGNTPTTVTEVMYCLATLLLSLQKQHDLCRRLHFRVFYALFLYENDTKPSTVQLKDDSGTGQRKTSHHSIVGKFPLTHEQLRIVNHKLDREKNEVIKVVAFAGTGKTTTLIKFAEANIYQHLLYVAFNKSVQVEAAKVFPGNTECRTSHSLAYEKMRYKYGRKLTFDLKPDMINDLIPKRPKGEKSPLQWALYARLVGETIKSFMASADEFITTKHVPVQYATASTFHRPLTHHDRMLLLKDAEYLWERMIDERDYDAKITHDGYFKVYQLSKPVITDVQCLLIDEAQDLTPAQQDVLLSQPLPKILVGDPHQQIYSFRGATNAMDAIQADKVYHLTQSFRFGSEIAFMANCVLDVYKDMTQHTIVGKGEEGTLCGEEVGQKAIICRGNITVFTQAVKLCEMEGQEKLRLGFTGFGEGKSCKSGFNFEKLMELYKMSTGACGRSLQNPLFKKMQTFGNVEVYAHNAEDSELLALISIVKLYNHRIPELIQRIKSKTAKELQFATVVLTTAHKSKGLEFDTVQLTDDFKMFGPKVTMGEEGMLITDDVNIPEDEKNLIYVAVTRTKKSLRLNEGLRKCLGKASEQFKFPIPTKQFLECPHSNEEQRCLDCGVPITELKRVTMSKVWSVKLVSSSQHENHPTNSGGFICSSCSYHHLPGFEKIFLGDEDAPQAASIM
ncbi:F-box DNA helicase 1 [Holothuria leucospilota]|uniref:F-box DNA helicase 1 n=1 Tax=Holothuria leucospilota TaxID=206669 RepID=A0A9Q1CKK5_HOLLE|nr:F-box DNA helicase 1 [Holothuria leucospilota]